MIKKNWPGIIGGLVIFLIILFYIIYINSNFDQQLINDVEKGVPSDKLMSKIEKETTKDELKVKKHINSHIMNVNMWGNGNMASKKDYYYYEILYYNQINEILELGKIRKKFAKREISKEQFIIEIEEYKRDLDRTS